MKLLVVGGGLTGLAAAHRAVELARERGRPLELTLLEGSDRLGGTIQTERRDGFLVECGPDSFLSEKPWALALCRRLGVEDRLIGTDNRFRRVFVAFRGRLHPLPDGFQLLAPTRLRPVPGLVALLVARQAADGLRPGPAARRRRPDESLGAFVRRRLGREALERVAQPLVGGIYTADPDELSLGATMPRFLEMERRERSVILALWRAARRAPALHAGTSGARWSLFVTFAEGMEELVRLLATRLPPGAVRLKERAATVERDGGRLARHHRGRRGLHRRRADPVAGGAPGRAAPALRGSRARAPARGDSLRVLRHRDARLSPRRHPPSPRRLRLRGARRWSAGRSSRAPSRA